MGVVEWLDGVALESARGRTCMSPRLVLIGFGAAAAGAHAGGSSSSSSSRAAAAAAVDLKRVFCRFYVKDCANARLARVHEIRMRKHQSSHHRMCPICPYYQIPLFIRPIRKFHHQRIRNQSLLQ
jgi:hypothetical protein